MMKVIVGLFFYFSLVGLSLAEAQMQPQPQPSFTVDSQKTQAQEWEVGSTVATGEFNQLPVHRVFMGVTEDGFYKVQDFYSNSNAKLTDPYWLWNRSDVIGAYAFSESLGYRGITSRYQGYYPNGNKQFDANFLYGVAQGSFTSWYENGQLQTQLTMKNDQPVGIARAWDEKGGLIVEKDFSNP